MQKNANHDVREDSYITLPLNPKIGQMQEHSKGDDEEDNGNKGISTFAIRSTAKFREEALGKRTMLWRTSGGVDDGRVDTGSTMQAMDKLCFGKQRKRGGHLQNEEEYGYAEVNKVEYDNDQEIPTPVEDALVGENVIQNETTMESKNWLSPTERKEIGHDEMEGMKVEVDSKVEVMKKKDRGYENDVDRGYAETYQKSLVKKHVPSRSKIKIENGKPIKDNTKTEKEEEGPLSMTSPEEEGQALLMSNPTIDSKTPEDANHDVPTQRNYIVSPSSHLKQDMKAFNFQKNNCSDNSFSSKTILMLASHYLIAGTITHLFSGIEVVAQATHLKVG